MKKINRIFQFQPFSRKQRKVLNWWCRTSPVKDYDGIISDGAIRSGKTVSMSLSFVMWAMSSFTGQNFAMCGKTIGSFRRNVLFWLKLMLKSRGYKVADHRADNLLVVTRRGVENYFYIFGGKDERSQDLIQGITLAGVFFDEVALMHVGAIDVAVEVAAGEPGNGHAEHGANRKWAKIHFKNLGTNPKPPPGIRRRAGRGG